MQFLGYFTTSCLILLGGHWEVFQSGVSVTFVQHLLVLLFSPILGLVFFYLSIIYFEGAWRSVKAFQKIEIDRSSLAMRYSEPGIFFELRVKVVPFDDIKNVLVKDRFSVWEILGSIGEREHSLGKLIIELKDGSSISVGEKLTTQEANEVRSQLMSCIFPER